MQQNICNYPKYLRYEKSRNFPLLSAKFCATSIQKITVVKYIQTLLGHFDIRTTLWYLHVARMKVVNSKSPADDLFKDGGLEW